MEQTDITSGFESWLINSVALLLIFATATMGMTAENMRDQPASGVKIETLAAHADVLNSHLQNGDGLMRGMLSAASKACCPCDTSDLCLADPPDGFVLLSAELSATNLSSLTSQPPNAPPRT